MLDLFNNVKRPEQPPQRPVINRHNKTYDEKLAEERYDLFTSKDVVEHFDRYYKKCFGKMKDFNRDNAQKQVEELFQVGYSVDDLTLYIEFVFESDQTFIDKEKCAMGTFKIQKFVDYIEANLDDFENGESVNKKEKKEDFKGSIDKTKEWSKERTGRIVFELPRFF